VLVETLLVLKLFEGGSASPYTGTFVGGFSGAPLDLPPYTGPSVPYTGPAVSYSATATYTGSFVRTDGAPYIADYTGQIATSVYR
jgi:hypothetical protein